MLVEENHHLIEATSFWLLCGMPSTHNPGNGPVHILGLVIVGCKAGRGPCSSLQSSKHRGTGTQAQDLVGEVAIKAVDTATEGESSPCMTTFNRPASDNRFKLI